MNHVCCWPQGCRQPPLPDSHGQGTARWPRTLCCLRKQPGKGRSFVLGTGEALPWCQAQSPALSPSSELTPAGSHSTQPVTRTRSQAPACLPASCPQFHPISLITPFSSCRSQLFSYTHSYLGQGSTDIPSTLREINYPPWRWESYAMASSWRSPSCLADHGLRAATMESLGLPAAEQAPGAALDLPITGYLPAADASPGHSSSALPCSRDRSLAPAVLPPTPLTLPSLCMFAEDSLGPSLLSYCHGERYL